MPRGEPSSDVQDARVRRRVALAVALRDAPPERTILMLCDLSDFARRLAEAAERARD
jgi:hypothetical protein